MRAIGMLWVGMAGLLITGAAAAQTIDADPSDFDVIGFNGSGIVDGNGLAAVQVGDVVDVNYTKLYLVRFPLDALPVDFVTATLELALLQTQRDAGLGGGVTDDVPPFENPGLGDLLAIPVPDYVTPSASAYSTTPIGDPVVLVAAGELAPALVSADVTTAVRAAKDTALPFATFRVAIVKDTDGDGLSDFFLFGTTEALDVATHPVLVYTPEPGAASAAAGALVSLVALARRSARR